MKNKPQNSTDANSSDDDQILNSRLVALDILANVLDRKQSLDNTLDTHQGFQTLPVREKAFVRMMTTTTIRRLGQIDNLIQRAQDRPDARRATTVTNILRLGTAQMFFMVVPDHATVDTSVQLADKLGHERQKDFVNALLRKLTREGAKWVKGQDPARLNTPAWLFEIWVQDYGLETALEIATANLSEAPLDISVKKSEDKSYFGSVLKATELTTGTLRRLMGGNVRDLEGFDDGRWWVQDAAAALAAHLLEVKQSDRIADLCAAPGGKTLQLASAGARVIALDRSAKRLKRLEENLLRMGLRDQVEIEVADATVWHPKKPVSKILLDAPCSATGTIRRNPDIPHLKTIDDIQNLTLIQYRLLEHSAKILASGGMLVYCTCSLQHDEGERQIERFLQAHPEFSRRAVHPDEIGGHKELINPHGDLRILPTHLSAQGGMDGFFISRLMKA